MNKRNKPLEYDYCNKLKNAVIDSFEDYNLDFQWVSAGTDKSDPVYIFHPSYDEHKAEGGINLVGLNPDIISEMNDNDLQIFRNFLNRVTSTYLKNNPIKDVECQVTLIMTQFCDNPKIVKSDSTGLQIELDLDMIYK